MKEYKKGDKFRPRAKVLKLKGKVPTVLQIGGRRYVFEPEGKRR
ncbi:hypothetical protein [Virgibacillus doumboii]|nr:hypothetical protein [Virgibacillus doumboii]